MTGSELFLQDNDARLIREMMERISRLENQALSNSFPPGSLIPFLGPARSSKWSDTRYEAIANGWTHWYKLNELDGNFQDATGSDEFEGIPKASSEADLPLPGQIGGLVDESSRSVYFPGKSQSRIETPLLSNLSDNFTMEVVFKPESLPQKSMVFWNGSETNGYGIGIGNSTGTESGSQLLFATSASVVNTGVVLDAGLWYDVIAMRTGEALVWYVGTFNPATQAYTQSSGAAFPTMSTPSTRSVVGALAAGLWEFKGWVDEAIIYNGTLSGAEGKFSPFDRMRTAMEPAPPYGFVKADGTAVSRAKFDRLFKRINVLHGAGDGTSTFNLPNLLGRIPSGQNVSSLGQVIEHKYAGGPEVFPSTVTVNYLVKT